MRFILSLLLLPTLLTAQNYTKCTIYRVDPGQPKTHGTINEIKYFTEGKMTYSRTFCDGNDTTCWRSTSRCLYNRDGLIADSTSVLAKGDTIITHFIYNERKLKDSSRSVTTQHMKSRSGGDSTTSTTETHYYRYDNEGREQLHIQLTLYPNGASYCSRHVTNYKPHLPGKISMQTTDTLASAPVKSIAAALADTTKWHWPMVFVTDYTKNGYEKKYYELMRPENNSTSNMTYTFDEHGRIVQESFTSKGLSSIIKYEYAPEKRTSYLQITYMERLTMAYDYVYE